MSSDNLTLAFIKIDEKFYPSHVSEIKEDDVYYLVADGTKGDVMIATKNAELSQNNIWVVSGKRTEQV